MKATHNAIIILSVLNILFMLVVWQFDKHLYIPFLQKMKLQSVKEPEYNPYLLRLGLWVAGGGILFYALIGWHWLRVL